MTRQSSEAADTALDEQQVVEFLRHHPDLLRRHPDLLAELNVPHTPGAGTVSLVERQVQRLREQREEMRHRLDDLYTLARENESLSVQFHQLVLDLLGAREPAAVAAALEQDLRRDCDADAVALRLYPAGDHRIPDHLIGPRGADRNRLERIFAAPNPVCGRLDPEIGALLFGDGGEAMVSAALIPLPLRGRSLGLLAVGSTDPERFRAGQGTLFLEQLGEAAAAALNPHLAG
ncbi:MAG: DUF484 family protein [Thiohalospira sp.]